jgi:hypothetical protein
MSGSSVQCRIVYQPALSNISSPKDSPILPVVYVVSLIVQMFCGILTKVHFPCRKSLVTRTVSRDDRVSIYVQSTEIDNPVYCSSEAQISSSTCKVRRVHFLVMLHFRISDVTMCFCCERFSFTAV